MKNFLLAIILLFAFSIRLVYSWQLDLWDGPDEYPHFIHVQKVAAGNLVPKQPEMQAEQKSWQDYGQTELWQPPLYYWLLAPQLKAFQHLNLSQFWQVHLLRINSVFLGGGLVLVIYAITRQILRNSPVVALGAAAFVAGLPTHITLSGVINNDHLVNLLVAVLLLYTFRVASQKNLRIGSLVGLGGFDGDYIFK